MSQDTSLLGGLGGTSVPQKILKFEILKSLEMHLPVNCQSLTITMLFCIISAESFMIPSGGHFWLLRGGACAPCAPTAYGSGSRIVVYKYLSVAKPL